VSNARTSDLWWKTAVIYCLDVETFFDWDGDGIGDLTGLTERIDYLAGLGISCIWLMPFQPSPNRDDGYDITDYYGVDSRLGSLGDFVALVRTANDRGLRVIIDLVVNHTSDRHPWFRAARASRTSEFRDFYVWADKPPGKPKAEVVFPDAEVSIWTYDDKAGQFYLHHFYSHQPDLNIGNPRVRDEIAKVIGFWLELGVDGFRMDAVPFLLETGGIAGDLELDPHDFLRDLRSFVARRRGDALLLGEVNLPADDLLQYFGGADGDEVQLLFNFPLMQATYLLRPARRHGHRRRLDEHGAPNRRSAVRQLPAQPRRADARQTDRQRARRGVRRLRTGRGDAAVRSRSPPTPAIDVRRRRPTDPHGLQPDVLPPGHSRAVLR
jgi:glycosidase